MDDRDAPCANQKMANLVFMTGCYFTLFHPLNILQLPRLLEERFQRAVETEDREPALAGDGLDPVLLLACGHLGAEVNVHRAIGVNLRAAIQADRGKLLAILQLGPAERIVNQHRPEILGGHLGRNVELVVFRAIEEVARAILVGPQVVGT